VGGWGRVPFSRNLMSPTPRRKWYLTTGRRFHWMVLDPIPQSSPGTFFWVSTPAPHLSICPTSSLRWAHPTSSQHLKQSKFEDFCSVKETYFCTAKTSIEFFFLVFRPTKSRERDIRKKNYLPGHFDGLDQLKFGLGRLIIHQMVSGHN